MRETFNLKILPFYTDKVTSMNVAVQVNSPEPLLAPRKKYILSPLSSFSKLASTSEN